jgi:hypothetical protein
MDEIFTSLYIALSICKDIADLRYVTVQYIDKGAYIKYWLIKKLKYLCKAHDFLLLGI